MAVVGVLVDAEVGDQHDLVAHLGAQVLRARAARCPSGSHAPEPSASLWAGTPKRMTAGHAEAGQLADLLAERLAGVLHDAREAGDRLRLVDALAHEQRGDEVVDADAGLGHEPAQGRRAAQPAEPALGEGHRRAGYRCLPDR